MKFKEGEVIEVDNNKDFSNAESRTFLHETREGYHLCVHSDYLEEYKDEEPFLVTAWPYARKIMPDLPVDTPILVRDKNRTDWVPQHFKKFDLNGRAICFGNGKTSFTINSHGLTCQVWDKWKLPKENE